MAWTNKAVAKDADNKKSQSKKEKQRYAKEL